MNTIIRYLTIAVVCGGGVVLLGFSGETIAQNPCARSGEDLATFKPYICDVSLPAGGETQELTWRLTFTESVGGVSWNDFLIEETTEFVTGLPDGTPARRYGLGTVWLDFKKINSTVYDISMRWDCTASDNDCSHNEDFEPTYQQGARNDRYEGEVSLDLASDAEFIEMQTPASPLPHAHADTTVRVTVH